MVGTPAVGTASMSASGSVRVEGPPVEFANFVKLCRDDEGREQDDRLLDELGRALDHFPDGPAVPPARRATNTGAGYSGTVTQPLPPQRPVGTTTQPRAGRRAPPPPADPPQRVDAGAEVPASRPLTGRCALQGVPEATALCCERIKAHQKVLVNARTHAERTAAAELPPSPFVALLERLLRKAEQPLQLSDLRDDRTQHQAVLTLIDTAATCLELPVPGPRRAAATLLFRVINDMRDKGYDDLNPPPALSKKRDTRYRVLEESTAIPALVAAADNAIALHDESLFALRALRDASTYRAVSRRMWRIGLFDCIAGLIDRVLKGEAGIEDERLAPAIELLWNIAELDPTSRPALGSPTILAVLRKLLQTFLEQGHRLRDKELRNDLIVVLTMAADTSEKTTHPNFLSSGITELAWLIGCGAELGLHQREEYKPRMKPFVLTCSQEDFEMKRLLWNLLYLLCFTDENLTFILEHDVLTVLLAYVDAGCEIPSVLRWPTLQLIDLQTQSLNLQCQLAVRGAPSFAAAGGAGVLLTFLQECLDVPLRNATLRVLVHVAATENRRQLAEHGAVRIMLALAEQAPEIEVKRDCLQILADTVNGDSGQQREFDLSHGIGTIVPFLSLPIQSRNRQVEQLVFAAIDCVWNCVVGHAPSEKKFLRDDGMHCLLDILQLAPEWIRVPLLSCINDLLASNQEAVHELMEWRAADGATAPQLLIRLWRADDLALGIAADGVIPEEGTGPPFHSTFGADTVQGELSGGADGGGIATEKLMSRPSMAPQALGNPGVHRSSVGRTSAASFGGSLADSAGVATEVEVPAEEEQPLPEHDIKVKIFCIFSRAGLSAASPDLATLTNEEKQCVEVILQFAALKRDNVWLEIEHALEHDGIRPIGLDRARIDVARRAAARRWGCIREKQQHLRAAHQAWADQEEATFYKGILRDCDMSGGAAQRQTAVQGGRTGLSITEAKIRKAQMLKASFKSAVQPAGAQVSSADAGFASTQPAPATAAVPAGNPRPASATAAIESGPAGMGSTEGEKMLSRLEWEVFELINEVRTDPTSFVPHIQRYVDAMDSSGTIKIGGRIIPTQEGKQPFLEAIAFLKGKGGEKEGTALEATPGLIFAAKDHARDQSKQEAPESIGSEGSSPLVRMNRYGLATDGNAEVLALGEHAAGDIVLRIIVNDAVESRIDRINICSTEYRHIGIACASNPVFGHLCVIDLSGGYQNKDLKEQQAVHNRHKID